MTTGLATRRIDAGEALEELWPIRLLDLWPCWWARKNLATKRQSLLPVPIGEQAVTAEPHKAVGQDVEEKPTEKLLAREVISRWQWSSA